MNISQFPTKEQIHNNRVKKVAELLKKGCKSKVTNDSRHGMRFTPVEQFEGHCLYLKYLMSLPRFSQQ